MLNPFFILPPQMQLRYRNAVKSENPPHIYAIADWAYSGMTGTGRDQCIVVRYAPLAFGPRQSKSDQRKRAGSSTADTDRH